MRRILDFTKVVLVLFWIGATVVRSHKNEYLNPEWVDPHDWTKDKDPLQKLCPQSDLCKPCEKTFKSEYLRLVNSLFNPSEFRFDETTQFMYRNVHIHITKEQFEKLQKSNDPAYIDGVVSEVLAQTEFGTVQLVKEYTTDVITSIWSHMPKLPSFSSMPAIDDINFNTLPRSRSIFINFIVVVLSFFACRHFKIPYLVFVFFATVYFLYEYLDSECQRRIELNQAVDFIYGEEKNPCMSPTKMSWIDWLVGKDGRSKCRDFLEKQSTTKSQCGIVDLFHEFFVNVLMKQLKTFFLTVADIIQSISTTNGILITAVTVYFMKDLLVTLIRSVFKYVVNPTIWSRVVADINSSPTSSEPVERVETLPQSDLRDLNVSKALDLANHQMKIICKKMELLNVQPSGAEVLAVKAAASDTSMADTTPPFFKEPLNDDGQHNASSTSSEKSGSFEEFCKDELKNAYDASQNISVVTINDTQLSGMPEDTQTSMILESTQSYEHSQSSEKFDYDASIEDSQHTNKSGNTSKMSDSMKSNSSDSIEVLSISSDVPL